MQFRLTVLITLALFFFTAQAAPHNELLGRAPQRQAASTAKAGATKASAAAAGKATNNQRANFRKAAAARASAAAKAKADAAKADAAKADAAKADAAKANAAKANAAKAIATKAGAGGNAGAQAAKASASAAAAKASASAAAAKAAAAKGGAKAGTGNTAGQGAAAAAGAKNAAAVQGGNNNGDPQKSLTLNPKVIAKGFAKNGQEVPTAGQVPSITSTNNFMNFCLTVNKPITNGQQITTGSCNPAPIGVIPNIDRMPSAKFKFPPNFGTIKANTAFTVQMEIKNLQTGAFTNAQQTYFAAPQQLNGGGIIIGHSHITIDPISSLKDTKPTDPKKFAFFKGLNAAAKNGILTADVEKGLPVGVYRLASINSAANHQPVIVPVAQHGSLDDAIYFTVTADGKPAK